MSSNIIKGDFAEEIIKSSEAADTSICRFFVHQVNCKQVAGAGLALQIRNRIPGWYKRYTNERGRLGEYSIYDIGKSTRIVNLYGQYSYGKAGKYTNYKALKKGLSGLNRYITTLSHTIDATPEVWFPHGMGAGLGGGDWNKIRQIIESCIEFHIVYVVFINQEKYSIK